MAAKMLMIATTTKSSISVKPDSLCNLNFCIYSISFSMWFLLCLRAPATRSGDYTAHAGIGPIDAGAVSMRCCQYEGAIGIVYRCVHGYTCGLIIPGRHPVAEGTALVY